MGRRSCTVYKNVRLKRGILDIYMFQAGALQEFAQFISVRAITAKAKESVGAKQIGRIPRDRTPELHQIR